jgi:hypothetical protein
LERETAGHRLRTQVQPSPRARRRGAGGLALLAALVREGGIRIRSWDAAAPEPAPSIHTLVQLDGDTLLHVHPGALLLPDLLAHHQREVSKTLARLHRSLGRLRVAVVSVGTSVGAGLGVSAWEWVPELLLGAWLQGALVLAGGVVVGVSADGARHWMLRHGMRFGIHLPRVRLGVQLGIHRAAGTLVPRLAPPRTLRALFRDAVDEHEQSEARQADH